MPECAHKNITTKQPTSIQHVAMLAWPPNVLRAMVAGTFSTVQVPNELRAWCAFTILASSCASRHNAVHFLNSSTSKSAPACSGHEVFWSFYFRMCFAPACTLRHLNLAEVFWSFLLPNLLSATAACNFWSLIWPDSSAPAALGNLLFEPSEPQNIRKKHSASRLFYLCARFDLLLLTLSLLTLSLLWLFSPLLLHLFISRKLDFQTSFDERHRNLSHMFSGNSYKL